MKLSFFKTEQELVEEIHGEVDTAQDRLLKEAHALLKNIVVPTVGEKEEAMADRLAKVGFHSNPLVKKIENERQLAWKKQSERSMSAETAKLIEHYRTEYPFLKFLTEEELDRICTKYKLIHAPVSRYCRDVPEKNLRDIENAQTLKKEDCLWGYELEKIEELEKKANEPKKIEPHPMWNGLRRRQWQGENVAYYRERINQYEKAGLFIAAPKSHFDLRGLKKSGLFGFVEPKDPIVFRYVKGGIQVLTKWGLEANDPSLVLPINN